MNSSDQVLPEWRFNRRACLGIATACALQACAVTAPTNKDEPARVIALLTAQADAWDKAIVRKDRAAIESNMAEDFRQIDGQGNVETKRSFVDDLMSRTW